MWPLDLTPCRPHAAGAGPLGSLPTAWTAPMVHSPLLPPRAVLPRPQWYHAVPNPASCHVGYTSGVQQPPPHQALPCQVFSHHAAVGEVATGAHRPHVNGFQATSGWTALLYTMRWLGLLMQVWLQLPAGLLLDCSTPHDTCLQHSESSYNTLGRSEGKRLLNSETSCRSVPLSSKGITAEEQA